MKKTRVSMVVTKKLAVACVGIVPAFFVLVGGVCFAQGPDKPADLLTAPLISCLDTCQGSACMRACIAANEVPAGTQIQTRAVPGTVMVGCSAESMNNITTCGQIFLVPLENADFDGFWVCADGAVQLFAQCPAFESSSNPDGTAKLGMFSLERMVDVVDYTLADARAGQLEPLAPSHIALNSETGGPSGPSRGPSRLQGVPKAEPVTRTFVECADEFKTNTDYCGIIFNAGRLLTACERVAEQQFQNFLGLKVTK